MAAASLLLSAFHDTVREQIAWCGTIFGLVNDFGVSRMRSICRGRGKGSEAMKVILEIRNLCAGKLRPSDSKQR